MRQVDQQLSHGFVEHNGITFLHEFPYNFALVIFDNQDLDRVSAAITDQDKDDTPPLASPFVQRRPIVG